jgi:hypothetical protein
MIRRYLLLLSVLGLMLSTMEGCFVKKNRCAACPGDKVKRVKRVNKGSL